MALGGTAGREVRGRMEPVLRDVPIAQIERDPDQPRKELGDLEGLIASIGRYGILQPPVVTETETNQYRLLAGERRLTAAKELGHTTITVIVRTVEEQQRGYLQLVENLQREDLDPFEQAESFRKLMEEYGIGEEQLGARVGKSQDHVSRALTIASNIPPEIREEYYATSRKVSPSILLEIARADTPQKQRRMWESAKAGRLTVRQARAERAGAGTNIRGQQASQPPTRETIRLDRATITIRCKSEVDLDEIVEILQEAVSQCQKSLITPQAEEDVRVTSKH
jgi:ParB family chromosome partitioning protein